MSSNGKPFIWWLLVLKEKNAEMDADKSISDVSPVLGSTPRYILPAKTVKQVGGRRYGQGN